MSRVAVAVLAELAISPRTVNHARELGAEAVLVGCCTKPFETPPGVRVRAISSGKRAGEKRSRAFFAVYSAARMTAASLGLLRALAGEKPRAILMQNPPGIPALLAGWAAARICGARFVIDWHNYGFSLLWPRLGRNSLLARFAEWFEGWAGSLADAHFCVSEKMREDLLTRFGIEASVLYDRPVRYREQRPAGARRVVVAPSGWGADEDTGMLLDAIGATEPGAMELHLTGDGPSRALFDPRIQEMRAAGFDIRTGRLPEAEYWGLIERADLGVSMHVSSSGLDLAMKVVDLYSARVPVCAFDYGGSLPEQVTSGLFRTAAELGEMLRAAELPPPPGWTETWSDVWRRVARPVLG